MSRNALTLAGVAVLFAAALAWAQQGAADDTKGLDEALKAWEAAFNAHDVKALGALYTEDAESVLPDGRRLEGRAAHKKDNAETFAKNPRVKAKLTAISRQLIKPDVAIEDGVIEFSGVSEHSLPPKNLYTTVLIKQGGKWLAVGDRSYVLVGGTEASKDSEKK